MTERTVYSRCREPIYESRWNSMSGIHSELCHDCAEYEARDDVIARVRSLDFEEDLRQCTICGDFCERHSTCDDCWNQMVVETYIEMLG